MLKNYVLADPQPSTVPPQGSIISSAAMTTTTTTTSASLNQQTSPG